MPRRRVAVSAALLGLPLSGCGGVMDPQGPVGAAQKLILIDSTVIMLVIVVPVIVATFAFAWWFRASNDRAFYWPDWAFSGHLELIVWAIPALVITFLGGIAWFGSQALDPFRPLASQKRPIEVQVVSLDWKWLFLYPEDGVATVNQLVVPVGTPIHFRLTSSGVMNAFFVPQLGSMVYSMAGMVSQLHLQADRAGEYLGMSSQFSGEGFPTMTFKVKAVSDAEYAKWLADTLTSSAPPLDEAAYVELVKPSQSVAPKTFTPVERGLFDLIIDRTVHPPPAAVSLSDSFWAWCGFGARSREGL
jgi:cytochrome o ubiquinol oxidase subunit II